MFLKNGDYIKESSISFLSTIQTVKGERRWNASMTKELVDDDTYVIHMKLENLEMTLKYSDKIEAVEDYTNIRSGLS